MSPPTDIAEFLASRRAGVTPEQVGLPTWGPRRVKGLRREEVASLAGVSVGCYKRLQRGNATGVSEDDGLTISVYRAEPGSRSAEALDLLASWTATSHEHPTIGEP